MVVHGEDSLNEHTEDEGLGVGGAQASSMDSLRMKLSRPKKDEGPTKEQLIATGELDPDEPEEVEGVEGDEGEGKKEDQGEPSSTGVTVPGEKDLSIRKQIEEGLMAGETRDELVARGFNKRSVQTIASELKSKMRTRTPIGKAPTTSSKGMPIFAHGSPPEAIIDSVDMPNMTDGEGPAFMQGTKFGMSLVVLGVRVAQELSGIGITQAKPILDMAKSMREGEAMAAKDAAGDAAMEAAGLVRDSMLPLLTNISRSGGEGGGDPMKNMMVRTMEPIMQKLMGGMLGRLAPGTAPLQITEAQEKGKVEGWSRRSE